ncbi:hypothetical protein AAV99_06850 [Aurantiacibacter marinus]|uniref:Uncharacterized protein n=2 Tax=Aurantiacibacter marinus TaxID=874156 RepID=A0A0H0XN93_9SPHN|nr:hypothetical protein AAV99_06850 [Aurantiacibacter marinus]
MNFDLEMVREFLDQIEDELELGLEVDDLFDFTENTDVEDERQRTFDVEFRGDDVSMTYVVFMDDIDAPDVAFFVSDEELADAINKQMEAFCQKHGL